METQKTELYFYLIRDSKYVMCDIDLCAQSERSIEIKLFDIGSSKELSELLFLPCFIDPYPYGAKHSYDDYGRMIAGYINSIKVDWNYSKYEKMLTNPTVRIIFIDTFLLEKVKELLNRKEYKKNDAFRCAYELIFSKQLLRPNVWREYPICKSCGGTGNAYAGLNEIDCEKCKGRGFILNN